MTTSKSLLIAGSLMLTGSAFAQDAVPTELAPASQAVEAATMAGVIETLGDGEYTAFVPSNDALATVEAEATELMQDEAALATTIQAHVIEGNVSAEEAMALVTEGGGTASVDSLAGTPIELAMEGDALTVNGVAVSTADLSAGNVTIHVIDGAFPPEG